MEKRIVSPENDLVFKHLFGKPEHSDILAGFLSAVLQRPPEEFAELEFLDPHLVPDVADGKLVILDVRVKTAAGKTVDIELQVYRSPDMQARIIYYLSRLIAGQLKKGDEYGILKPVVGIVIADHAMMGAEPAFHNVYRFLNEQSHRPFSDLLEIHTLEVPKMTETDNEQEMKLINWLKFFKSETAVEMAKAATGDPAIQKAMDLVMQLSDDDQFQAEVWAREKAILDYNFFVGGARREGIEEGRAEGIKLGEARATARVLELLAQGYTAQQIRERMPA
jgi:predicted transposase/invertase (TIGR01784 family)